MLCPYILLDTAAPPHTYTLSLHDALPIFDGDPHAEEVMARLAAAGSVQCGFCTPGVVVALTGLAKDAGPQPGLDRVRARSEEHTSELQSPCNLVCRLLLEKKKQQQTITLY